MLCVAVISRVADAQSESSSGEVTPSVLRHHNMLTGQCMSPHTSHPTTHLKTLHQADDQCPVTLP